MKSLSEKQFKGLKNSDTLVIYGCGASINDIRRGQWRRLKGFDSVGFNWFCKAGIDTTYYIIYEQGRCARYGGDETPENLIDGLNSIRTNYVLHSAFARCISVRLKGSGMKFHCGRFGVKYFGRDIFRSLSHGKSTIFTALHLGVGLGYRRFVFAGVDLYDTRYFWLPPAKARPIMVAKRMKPSDLHKTCRVTVATVRSVKAKFGIKMEVVNPRSLLAGVAKPWGVK